MVGSLAADVAGVVGMLSECVGVVLDLEDRDLRAAAKRLQNARTKRALDSFGAAIGLAFIAPFLALIALLIIIDSRGPILFQQRRTGYNGVPFVIYKFRTMHVLEDGASVTPAIPQDSRSTWLGRFLRRSSIDELPQLLNVLKGDMSLVGPRPHAIAHDEYYARTVPGYNLRFNAKPGMTGLAQVSGFRGGRAHTGMVDLVAHDVEYIRNWSLMLDVQILFRTLMIVPFDSAAY